MPHPPSQGQPEGPKGRPLAWRRHPSEHRPLSILHRSRGQREWALRLPPSAVGATGRSGAGTGVDALAIGSGFAGLRSLHAMRGLGLKVVVFENGSSVDEVYEGAR